MRRTLIIIACLIALPFQAFGFEMTPMVGYTFGGEVATDTDEALTFDEGGSFALALDFDLPQSNKKIELFWSHQQTALSDSSGTHIFNTGIDYVHIGGMVLYPQEGFIPFAAGGLGVTHFSPDNGYKPETRFSLSVGGGVKTFITKRLGLRLEGRGYATLFPETGYIFCGNGGCSVYASGDVIFQFEGLAGAFFVF